MVELMDPAMWNWRMTPLLLARYPRRHMMIAAILSRPDAANALQVIVAAFQFWRTGHAERAAKRTQR